MIGAALFLATVLLSGAGFGMLALSQKSHRAALGRTWPAPPLRLGGAALLAASLAAAVARDGWVFGLIVWVTVLSVSAGVVVALLTKRHER